MVQRTLRVYISSTFSDLQEHREAVRDSVLRAGANPVVMETFGASSDPPLDVCRHEVRDSDVMILLVAHRYGAVLPGAEASLTEFEYRSAREAAIPVLVFILDEKYPWPPQFIDVGEAADRLRAFKDRLRSDSIIEYFASPSDLALRVLQALLSFLARHGLEPEAVLHPEQVAARMPTDGDRDELLTKIESHLNSLRANLAEIRDRIERTSAIPAVSGDLSYQSAAFLGPVADTEDDLCFVAMPYSKAWSKSLEDILLDICKSSGLRLLIAKNMDGRFIPHDIWRGITAAAVIVADITDGNPNVAYEIGLADVLGKEVVLLCQGATVPFDFLGQRLISYEDTMKGSIVLREELTARLRRIRSKSTG